MAQAPDLEPHKRKRDIDDTGDRPAHHRQPPAPPPSSHQASSQHVAQSSINYLPRPDSHRLSLIPGDSETFSEIIHLIGEYEGVLDHNQSLATNLGARLTGPRVLKGIEKFFDGPIIINSPRTTSNPITWVDIVAFAKANPNAFVLTSLSDGSRCCRFVCKGHDVEIIEDDWRLISSGGLDRFSLEHPFEEDETAELATLEILEQRASALYKKADEVAARARILHHKLGHRKQDLARRRQAHDESSGAKFHAVNHPQRPTGYGSTSYDLHADLLQQFASAAPNSMLSVSSSGPQSRSTSGAGVQAFGHNAPSPHQETPQQPQRVSGQPSFSGLGYPAEIGNPTTSTSQGASETHAEIYKSLVTQKTDKLAKGDTISPPCDRCRRLRLQCIKHLTACQGCTKKHAKCSWKSVTEEEAARLRGEMGMQNIQMSGEGGTTEVDIPGSRGSGAIRTPGSVGPGTILFENTSRPASRAETDSGAPISYSRSDVSHEPARVSLPADRFGSGQPSIPRDPSRMGHISSILSPADYDQPFGNLHNPTSR